MSLVWFKVLYVKILVEEMWGNFIRIGIEVCEGYIKIKVIIVLVKF